MALTEGQVQLRDLVVGPGTPFRFVKGSHFNPFARTVRVDQSAARSWADGAWSGAEWAEQITVPMRLVVLASGAAEYAERMHELLTAFAPSHVDVDLRFVIGGVEYLMRGRPRMVDPESRHIDGHTFVQAAFVALTPRIWSAAETVLSTGLPTSTGGITWDPGGLTWPVTWPAVVSTGVIQAYNAGKVDTSPRLVVTGPCVGPRVLHTGLGRTLAWDITLTDGQWLDVDVARRTSLLNGQVSRAGLMTSREWFELPPGWSEIAFGAQLYDPLALLSVGFRSAWR
ncbi:phage distal tail protein [Micromonospora haikouensis]|uniref:phage distal tail protein n=1 Tax=Micromonospora haikouensis TaxID=686309 RepID=UPI003792780E